MELVRSCGCMFIQLLLVCVQCTVQSGTVIGVCTVYSVDSLAVHSTLYTHQQRLDK